MHESGQAHREGRRVNTAGPLTYGEPLRRARLVSFKNGFRQRLRAETSG